MIGRTLVAGLALAVAAPTGAIASTWSNAPTDDVVLRRDEEVDELVAVEDDDFDAMTGDNTGDNTGDSSGDSNDATGSGHTSVSRDRDRSRGDLTRDRTNDGPGRDNRDWSGGHTNDWSRNDTR